MCSMNHFPKNGIFTGKPLIQRNLIYLHSFLIKKQDQLRDINIYTIHLI